MRIFKVFAKFAIVLLLVFVINHVLAFALVPYGGSMDLMWKYYQEASDVDTLLIGSSQCHTGINGELLDSQTGFHSYNMSTDSQSYHDSLQALKKGIQDHDIKNVILVIDYDYMFEGNINDKGEANFSYYKKQYETITQAFLTDIRFLWYHRDSAISFNYFFPWSSNHIWVSPGSVINNIQNKMQGENAIPDANRVNTGFTPSEGELDFNTLGHVVNDNLWPDQISEKVIKDLEEFASICQKNGINLMAVTVPVPKSVVMQYGESYFEIGDYTSDLFAKYGFSFYDFNLASDELFHYDKTYFRDYAHLNSSGAEEYTNALACIVNAQMNGEKISDYFASSKEDVYDAVSFIDSVECEIESLPGDEMDISAHAYCGECVSVEYRFEISDEDNNICYVQEYGTDSNCSYKPDQNGTYNVTVWARKQGSNDDYDQYYNSQVEYWLY